MTTLAAYKCTYCGGFVYLDNLLLIASKPVKCPYCKESRSGYCWGDSAPVLAPVHNAPFAVERVNRCGD